MNSAPQVRPAVEGDIDAMLVLYYKVESRSAAPPMEGWSPKAMRSQFKFWLREPRIAMVLVVTLEERIIGFAVTLLRSNLMACLEIFCTDPDFRGDFRLRGETRHGGELLFREVCSRLRSAGVQCFNTMVNKLYHDFRRHTRFLRYRGFQKVAEFEEYEFLLADDDSRRPG